MIKKKGNEALLGIGLFITEVALLLFFFSFSWSSGFVIAVIGTPNANVTTLLEVGNVWPEVINVSIDDGAASITLSANTTVPVNCYGVIRDYTGESDMWKVNATLYSNQSNYTEPDDRNYHYTNTSCVINTSFGSFNGYNDDSYTSLANCSFDVYYYAVPGPWECHLWVEDKVNWTDNSTDNITMNQLLAIGLPDNIDYGVVNATYISNENITNVSNVGNVRINLSLEGFAVNVGDGDAFNCTRGNIQNISIEYEKFNLSTSHPGVITRGYLNDNYTNLTSGSAEIGLFNLSARFNDSAGATDYIKQSYWRVFVPLGVAGNCTGNIIFGATTAAATI